MEKQSLVLTAGEYNHSTLKIPGVSILTVPLTSSYTVSFLRLTLCVFISVGKRAIRALPVKCYKVERGCEWEGTVGTLDEHVAVCKFIPVPCPNLCKEKYKITLCMRKDLHHHVNNECPNRDHECPYCGEKGTYANITQIHDRVCKKKKIPCTNTECTKLIECGKMKQHLNVCDYTTIPCKYKNIGCDVKLKRKDMPAHEEDDDKVHLHQSLGTVVKLQYNLQSASDTIAALQGKVAALQRDRESANSTITALLGEVATLQKDKESANSTITALLGEVATLQRDKESANSTITALLNEVAALQDKVAALQGDMKSQQDTLQSVTNTGKLIFKLTEYQKKKYNNEITMSPSFYTSPEGYNMCLLVYANGNGDANNDVSVFVEILEGEHNKSLKWPFMGTYVFELLNQLEDKNHHLMSLNITSTHKLIIGSTWGYLKFISHSELSHDPSNNTQYLMDDTLYFRVTVTPSDHKPWLDQYH